MAISLGQTLYTVDYAKVHTGHLTFYGAGADSGGTCMYNNPKYNPSNLPTVAIGNFGVAEKCGTCVKITPKGTGSGVSDFPKRAPFVAFVNNQCPECGEDHLDLAEGSDGVWDITWTFVDCPVSGNIQLQLKTGSSKWHTEISARNFKTAITSIEYQLSGTWTKLDRKSYNYFVKDGEVVLPVNVRLTSGKGEQKTLTLTEANYGVIEPSLISTSVQFSGSGTPTPPSPPPTNPPPPSGTPKPTCAYIYSSDWWVELSASGATTQAVQIECSDGAKQTCTWNKDWSKYTCAIANKACTAPRRAIVANVCCSLDKACASSLMEDSMSEGSSMTSTGPIIGIVLGVVIVTALIIGLIVYRLRRQSTTEIV
jgi:expansin (peptidoglycan-binding protein)